MEINELYLDWEKRWSLSNPKPKIESIPVFVLALQSTVMIGSILLSGSRTGNAVAKIGALTELNGLLGAYGINKNLVGIIEGSLGFITFEAAVLLSGYLHAEEKVDKKWYWILLVSALTPAVFANILPAAESIEKYLTGVDTTSGISETTVSIIIGLTAPIMSYISGRVLGSLVNEVSSRYKTAKEAYELKKAHDWEKSKEYKAFVKSINVVPKTNSPENLEIEAPSKDPILEYLAGKPGVKVKALAEKFDKSVGEMMSIVTDLENKGKIVRNGVTVTLNEW